MPSLQYPFLYYKYADGTVDHQGHTMLPLRISNPATGSFLHVYGLIDTGADACLFPAKLATDLGHALRGNGVKSSVTMGIEQAQATTYKHTFKIELLAPDLKTVVWKSKSIQIDCMESNPPVLLGVDEFLNHFVLTVDYPKKRIMLSW